MFQLLLKEIFLRKESEIRDMNRRGASPIIATILLVSMVVAVGGMVAVWVNSQSQKTMNVEGERRERIADRENEALVLTAVTVATDTLTVFNSGTSDSVVTYVKINNDYTSMSVSVDMGEFADLTGPNLLPSDVNDINIVEIGTDLGNTFLFTAPCAVIRVESMFQSEGEAGHNRIIVLDGTGSTDADGTIVLWEWDLNEDGDFTDPEDGTGQRISVGVADFLLTDPQKTYTVTLRVTDNTGMTRMVTLDIQFKV